MANLRFGKSSSALYFLFRALIFFRFVDAELICSFDLINKQNSSIVQCIGKGGNEVEGKEVLFKVQRREERFGREGVNPKTSYHLSSYFGFTVCDMFKHKNLWCLIFFHLFTPLLPTPFLSLSPSLLFLKGGRLICWCLNPEGFYKREGIKEFLQ